MLRLDIAALPPTLNEQITLARTNRFQSAQAKDKWTNTLSLIFARATPVRYATPVHLEFIFYVKNFARDADNTDGARKYILDALVKAGIIPDDSLKWVVTPSVCWHVKGIQDKFSVLIYTESEWAERFPVTIPPTAAAFTALPGLIASDKHRMSKAEATKLATYKKRKPIKRTATKQ